MSNREQRTGINRRDFIRTAALGGGALFLFGTQGCLRAIRTGGGDGKTYSMIVVDYTKCTGCRTCEAVCAAHNHPVTVDGISMPGLGNPNLGYIQVHSYNPDVDVAAVCAMCPDAPCIAACPVERNEISGRKALFRDPVVGTIVNDPARCIGCGSCIEHCRVGVLRVNSDTGGPERMCTLCGGDPQCVKHCPYGALSYVTVDTSRPYYGMTPDDIADALARQWYGVGV